MRRAVHARPAQARRIDRHVGLRLRNGQPGAQAGQFPCLSTCRQAFHQPVQRPDVVGVLGAALHDAAQAEVVAIDLLGFGAMALVEQQRRQRVPRRGIHAHGSV